MATVQKTVSSWAQTIKQVVVLSGILACLFVPYSIAQAESPLDSDKPVLQPNIADNTTLRNSVVFKLDVIDAHPSQATIELLSADDRPLDIPVNALSSDGGKTVTLSWKTADVADGNYKVRYSATDAYGNSVSELRHFTINNAQPLVTLNENADGRTIGGSVSRPDVMFSLMINGETQALQPTIATTPDETGTYIWTFVLPETFKDGEYRIDVTVTVEQTQKTSDPVSATIAISTPLVVQKPVVDTAPLPVVEVLTDEEFAIGQFVAPTLPAARQTQLFGVTTTDITNTQTTEQAIAAPVLQSAAEVQRDGDVKGASTQRSVPIAATESGWMIFGIAWYWLIIIAVILLATGGIVVNGLRQSQRKQALARAQSLF
jgi:hypothetical protein